MCYKALDQNDNVIYASELHGDDYKGIPFLCPNKECNGGFLFRNNNTNSDSSCFFYKTFSRDKYGVTLVPHIKECWATRTTAASIFNTETFIFSDFIAGIGGRTNRIIPNQLRAIQTIKQLYTVCTGNDPETLLGDTLIKDLFVHSTTLPYYKDVQESFSTPRLFLLTRTPGNENYDEFTCEATCTDHSNVTLDFVIKFKHKFDLTSFSTSCLRDKRGISYDSPKFDFLLLGTPGQLIPTPDSCSFKQEILVEKLNHLVLL